MENNSTGQNPAELRERQSFSTANNSGNRGKQQRRSLSAWSSANFETSRLLALGLLLVLLIGLVAVDVATASPAPMRDSSSKYTNFVENLVQEYSDRLKKSKPNGVRQVKQTLRFGRRSDPWFAPAAISDEQLSLEELQNNQRLFGTGKFAD